LFIAAAVDANILRRGPYTQKSRAEREREREFGSGQCHLGHTGIVVEMITIVTSTVTARNC
jgi:hypothetical protein